VRRVRETSVAGSWYPDDPAHLREAVDRYVAEAEVAAPPGPPRALIVPHAGLTYSGPVAACAYKVVRDTFFAGSRGLDGPALRAIVMVGPSHFVPFRGVSLWPEGSWDTPLGRVAVDVELAAAIAAESREIADLPDAHAREHSLEMQLPFVAHLLPGVAIVPMVMGQQSRGTAMALGDALARAVARVPAPGGAAPGPAGDAGEPARGIGAGQGEVLFVASSDLSHYENAATAAALDAVVLRHVEALDPDGLMSALEHDPRHACGGGPMVAVLHAVRRLGATTARVLHYADSGDVSGDKSSVVGYVAAAVW
jgi:predicted class III extradiol MEMO1 family dioxygenase